VVLVLGVAVVVAMSSSLESLFAMALSC